MKTNFALASLDVFRGIVKATPDDQVPVLFLVSIDGGFRLVCRDLSLQSQLGRVRIFKTPEAAMKLISRSIANSVKSSVELRIKFSSEGDF
jgi:hypothetical protein